MNKEQADTLLTLCNKFCEDNKNNMFTEWSSGMFVKVMQGKLTEVLREDIKKENEVKKEITDLKERVKELENALKNDEETACDMGAEPQPTCGIPEETQEEILHVIEKSNKDSNDV